MTNRPPSGQDDFRQIQAIILPKDTVDHSFDSLISVVPKGEIRESIPSTVSKLWSYRCVQK